MPAFTRGRLKTLVFLALLVAVLAVLASLVYFRAGPKTPEGAEVVLVGGAEMRRGVPEARGDLSIERESGQGDRRESF